MIELERKRLENSIKKKIEHIIDGSEDMVLVVTEDEDKDEVEDVLHELYEEMVWNELSEEWDSRYGPDGPGDEYENEVGDIVDSVLRSNTKKIIDMIDMIEAGSMRYY